jgi:hypothetical protein
MTNTERKQREMVRSYSRSAVEREIQRDPRIKGREARLIHALLKGRQKEDEPQ